MRVTTLGTTWWSIDLNSSAYLLAFDDELVLFDCGKGVTEGIHRCGINPADVSHVFFTHHDWDHNMDIVHFVGAGWQMGRDRPLHVYGPHGIDDHPGTEAFVEGLFGPRGLWAMDIANRLRTQARSLDPAGIVVEAHDVTGAGHVCDIGRARITAMPVVHMAAVPSYAYRVDAPSGSVVITGDTVKLDAVADFARDADILVHDCTGTHDWLERYAEALNDGAWYHSSARQVGEVAAAAGVPKVIGVHLAPPLVNEKGRARIRAEIAESFDGEIFVAEDGLTVEAHPATAALSERSEQRDQGVWSQ